MRQSLIKDIKGGHSFRKKPDDPPWVESKSRFLVYFESTRKVF